MKFKTNNSMRKLSFLLFLTILFSCNQKAQTQNQNIQEQKIQKSDSIYGKELIENDFLKYAEVSKIDSLKKDLKDSFNIYDEANFKIADIDAEELAEFNFDFFLPRLNKILAKRNLQLTVETTIDFETTNDI